MNNIEELQTIILILLIRVIKISIPEKIQYSLNSKINEKKKEIE